MPMEIVMHRWDAEYMTDPATGQSVPNPDYLPPGDPKRLEFERKYAGEKNVAGLGTGAPADTFMPGATGSAPPSKKQAFFDKKTGGIMFNDGSKPNQTYDRQSRRRYYENGGEWHPVPLSEDEESAGLAATVAQGVLMGGGDEFLAAAANPGSALRAAFGNEPETGGYYKELERARSLETRYADENPWTAFGTKIVAGIPTAIATGGGAAALLTKGATALRTAAPVVSRTLAATAAPASTTMGSIGQGATGGVAFGSVAGFASGEGGAENRAASAGTGAAFGALVGMSLQSLSPAARWVYNQFKVQPQFWSASTGTLTTEGRQAVIRAGGDPDAISRELADAFAAQMRTAADPRAALASARTQTDLAVPVPLTQGMRSGNPREQMLESRARQGSSGDVAREVIDEADDNIRQALNQNVEAVRFGASGGRPAITPNDGGAAAQAALRQQATRSESVVDGAYQAAREAGEATIAPQRFNELAGQVMNDLGRFAPQAFPHTWREVSSALAFDARQNAGRLVSSLFAARARLVGLQSKPDEMAAATAAKHALDRMLRSLRPEDLQGNQSAVQTWQRAIAERARHGRQFESGVVGKVTKTSRMTDELEIAAGDVAARIIGSDISKKGGLLRDLVTIRGRLGASSPAWLDFKQEVVLRILDKSRGALMSGRGVEAQAGERSFAASQFAETVSKLMRERPGLMRFLFSPRELTVLQRTAEVAKLTVAREGGKQLGSGAAWASMIQQTFPAFYRSISFVADSAPVRSVINTVNAGAVRTATSGRLPQARTSYGARQAVTSATSQLQAKAGMEKYADGTALEKAAQVTTPVPLVGDAMGLAADVEGYSTGRLEASAENFGLTAMGMLPFVAGASALKGAGKAADISGGAANKTIHRSARAGYAPPNAPQREFEKDYRNGRYKNGKPIRREAGLEYDIDGRPLTAKFIAGRKVVGGADEPVDPTAFDEIARATTGVPARSAALPPETLGATTVLNTGRGQPRIPLLIELSPNATNAERPLVYAHELGHVIDDLVADLDVKGLEGALRRNYHTLALGKEAAPGVKLLGPEQLGYGKSSVKRELAAEAFRAYMTNPNYMKTHFPMIAARIRKFVNANPKLIKTIQFNSLAGGALAIGAASAGRSEQDPR